MKHRLVLVAAITAIVIAAAYWLLPSAPGASQPAASRAASATPRGAEPSLPAAPAAVARPKMVMTESGWRPQTSRKPRTWVDPVNGAVNREITDAVPDPDTAAAEELKYRKQRLPFKLADAAAPCWTGGDSREEIEFEYTLVVENEELRVYSAERLSGTFERSVRLPEYVEGDKIEATYQHGVLTISVPKAVAARPRKIDVKTV